MARESAAPDSMGSYYLARDGEAVGPLTVVELLRQVSADTMVWREGIDWQPASRVPELEAFFAEHQIGVNRQPEPEPDPDPDDPYPEPDPEPEPAAVLDASSSSSNSATGRSASASAPKATPISPPEPAALSPSRETRLIPRVLLPLLAAVVLVGGGGALAALFRGGDGSPKTGSGGPSDARGGVATSPAIEAPIYANVRRRGTVNLGVTDEQSADRRLLACLREVFGDRTVKFVRERTIDGLIAEMRAERIDLLLVEQDVGAQITRQTDRTSPFNLSDRSGLMILAAPRGNDRHLLNLNQCVSM